MAHIQDILHFRGHALEQFLLVATILGAFSMSGVIAMIAVHEKAKLRAAVFLVLSLASLAFVLATVVAVLILPFMDERTLVSDAGAVGLLRLYQLVVVAIVVGTIAMLTGMAMAGFLVSRRVGVCALVGTCLTTLGIAACAIYLSSILR